MGEDGHTASIFAGPDLQDALDAPKARRAVGVMPDPMPDDAPVPRVTLTRAAILSARTILITITATKSARCSSRRSPTAQSSCRSAACSPKPTSRSTSTGAPYSALVERFAPGLLADEGQTTTSDTAVKKAGYHRLA